MPVPDEELVRGVLSKNERDFACRLAVENAWATMKGEYPEQAWWRRKSTRAALMWEHTVNNAVGALETDPGVRILSHHDTTSFILDDTVLLRFKKASIQLRTSNFPTMLARLFHMHELDMFGFEGHHRVEVAHVLNRFETGLDWIGVVAREQDRVLWHFELGAKGEAIETLPLPLPVAPAGDRVLRPIAPRSEGSREEEIE